MAEYESLAAEARQKWLTGIEKLGGSLGWLKPVTEGQFLTTETGEEVRFLIHAGGRSVMIVIDEGDDAPGLSLTLELPEGLWFGTVLGTQQ